jgi:hypothetical protein
VEASSSANKRRAGAHSGLRTNASLAALTLAAGFRSLQAVAITISTKVLLILNVSKTDLNFSFKKCNLIVTS